MLEILVLILTIVNLAIGIIFGMGKIHKYLTKRKKRKNGIYDCGFRVNWNYNKE